MAFIFEMFSNPFDNKLAFWLTCILEFILFFFNALLIAHKIEGDELFDLIDTCIVWLMYLFVGCVALLFIHPIIHIVLSNANNYLIQKCKTKRRKLQKYKEKSALPLKIMACKVKAKDFENKFEKISRRYKFKVWPTTNEIMELSTWLWFILYFSLNLNQGIFVVFEFKLNLSDF